MTSSLSLDTSSIQYRCYNNEQDDMHQISALIENELSEPYSIFTYRYFVNNWPNLCIIAEDINIKSKDKIIGVIICRLTNDRDHRLRGYIAMLAVNINYRKKIGSTLVKKAMKQMKNLSCELVVLETEITNKGALALYEKLNFVRDIRLYKYYLNGIDAFRLKYWMKKPPEIEDIH